jgi:glycosyltransferase involved in cell wall biosynthesis
MHNSAKTIIRALESIKSQTYKGEFQIIIVDDGSIDNSAKLVEEYINNNFDLNIELFKKKNEGVSSARNFAMKFARGQYIAFLDSDDEWQEEKIQLQIESIIKSPNVDLLGCRNCNLTNTRLSNIQIIRLIKLKAFSYTMKTSLTTSGVIMRRSIYIEIGGFDEKMRYSEDMNYWLRIMGKFNCYILDYPLVKLENDSLIKHGGGLSRKTWEMEKGELNNITYIYKNKQINVLQYLFSFTFSFLKFMRRLILKYTT